MMDDRRVNLGADADTPSLPTPDALSSDGSSLEEEEPGLPLPDEALGRTTKSDLPTPGDSAFGEIESTPDKPGDGIDL